MEQGWSNLSVHKSLDVRFTSCLHDFLSHEITCRIAGPHQRVIFDINVSCYICP